VGFIISLTFLEILDCWNARGKTTLKYSDFKCEKIPRRFLIRAVYPIKRKI